jgi:low temperature requirement protein LtrA
MLQGAALLTALWSAWAVYSWLTNAVPAEEVIPARLVILTAMAAMFVASLAVPGAFGEYGVLFALAYLVVQLLQVILYALTTGREPEDSLARCSSSHRAFLDVLPDASFSKVARRGPKTLSS